MTDRTCLASETLKSAQNFTLKKKIVELELWEDGPPMVSALVSGLSDLGLSLAWDIGLCSCTLFSHSAALIPGVQMGTSRFNAGGSPATD